MSKYTFLLFKIFLFTAFLNDSQKILGKDELKAVDLNNINNKDLIKAEDAKKNKVKDWIELFRKEIRSVDPNEIEIKEEIKNSGTMESKNSRKGLIFHKIMH